MKVTVEVVVPFIRDVKYRGMRIGMLYVAEDWFLRYAKDPPQIPIE